MAKTWDDFVSFVAHSCVGCPPMTIRAHVQAAVDEFLTSTNIWTQELEPISLMDGLDRYPLPTELYTRVLGVESVKYNGLPLAPMTTRDMLQRFPWADPDGTNQVQAYRVELDDTEQMLVVWPTPSTTELQSVVVRASIVPTSDATYVPDWLYQDWRTVIGSGALSQILLIPNKDWTNPQMAAVHEGKFRAGKSRAKARSIGMQSGGNLTIRARRFGS